MSLPATVVAAIDFSPSSVRAAAVALSLMVAPARLFLAHVESSSPSSDGSGIRLQSDAERRLRDVAQTLDVPDRVVVETLVLNGAPAQSISELADRVGADLIAAGSHGHNPMERFVLGSVSTALVRNTTYPVLVAKA